MRAYEYERARRRAHTLTHASAPTINPVTKHAQIHTHLARSLPHSLSLKRTLTLSPFFHSLSHSDFFPFLISHMLSLALSLRRIFNLLPNLKFVKNKSSVLPAYQLPPSLACLTSILLDHRRLRVLVFSRVNFQKHQSVRAPAGNRNKCWLSKYFSCNVSCSK